MLIQYLRPPSRIVARERPAAGQKMATRPLLEYQVSTTLASAAYNSAVPANQGSSRQRPAGSRRALMESPAARTYFAAAASSRIHWNAAP